MDIILLTKTAAHIITLMYLGAGACIVMTICLALGATAYIMIVYLIVGAVAITILLVRAGAYITMMIYLILGAMACIMVLIHLKKGMVVYIMMLMHPT